MFARYNSQSRPSRPVSSGRKVFPNAMVAHVWAQQTNESGKSNNGNFYFIGDTIYSYGSHFPIARFSKDKSVVWFTSESYSVSTSCHVSYVRDALRGLGANVIPVGDLRQFDESRISKDKRELIERKLMRSNNAAGWRAFQNATGKPNRKWPENALALVDAYDAKLAKDNAAEKLRLARDAIAKGCKLDIPSLAPRLVNETLSDYPTPYYVAQNAQRECERYRANLASARALLSKQSPKSANDTARIRKASQLTKELARLRDVWGNVVSAMESARDESRDRAEIESALDAIANAKPRVYWFESGLGPNHCSETEVLGGKIRRALQIGFNPAQLAPLMQILQARLFYRESDRTTEEAASIVSARRMAELDSRYGRKPVSPEDWHNGQGAASQYRFSDTLIRRKGETLQTSRGAECPFRHAVLAFLKAQDCRANGKTWHRNGEQIRVGHFQVDSIAPNGDMVAGCHTLKWEEMLRLAIREIPHLVKPSYGLPVAL